MRNIALVLCLALPCIGCAGKKLAQPIAQFPSRPELEALPEPAAAPAESLQSLSVEHWATQIEAPEPGSPYPNDAAWDARLLQRAATAKLTPSPELRCAARETARFYSENGAFPDPGLRSFLLARCGSTLPRARLRAFTLEGDAARSEADLLASVSERLDSLLAGATRGAIGLGFAHGHGRASFVLYEGKPGMALEGFSPIVEGGTFSLRGHELGGAQPAMAIVTQGKYGVAKCEPDRQLQLPELGFVCPMQANDEQAIVEIVTRSPERPLETPVLRAMVRRSSGAALAYHLDVSALGSAARGARFEDSLLAALNRLRHAAHLGPLTLEPKQSRFNEQLAPRYFAAVTAEDTERSELLTLGVLAGWDVAGEVRTGSVYAHEESGTDGARWLGGALQDPLARYALLYPEASRVAIGEVPGASGRSRALVSTYVLSAPSDRTVGEDALFDELEKQRAARGLGAPFRRPRSPELTRVLEQLEHGELTSKQALDAALESVSKSTKLQLQGLVVETSDLSLASISERLLSPVSIDLELGVAQYKPDGAAWGQYAVLYLFAATTAKTGYHPELPAVCREVLPLRDAKTAPGPAEPGFADHYPARKAHALLAINPAVSPYKPVIPPACVKIGDMESSVVRICVSAEGKVAGVSILEESLPLIDSQLPTVIGRWRYHPLLRDGKPTPFCYTMRYNVK